MAPGSPSNGTKLTAIAHRLGALRIAAAAYLVFALVVTVAARVPSLAGIVPDFAIELFTPGDKENLAVYRVVHLLALALLFTYLVPRDWPALRSKWLQPVMKCGEEWLASFCIGVFLSFCSTFHPDHGTELGRDADPCQRRRNRDDDGDRLLHFLVAAAGPKDGSCTQKDGNRG